MGKVFPIKTVLPQVNEDRKRKYPVQALPEAMEKPGQFV